MKKISIVTPCYNCEKYLEQTYQSIKAQTYENWEWLCTDDQSTDNTYNKLIELSNTDSRIKVFQNSENAGAAVSRNVGLENASGDYIAFLDADDLWSPYKLETQINFMEDKDIAFTYHNYLMIDQNNKILKSQKPPSKMSANKLLRYNPFATSSVMIRSSIAKSFRFKVHLRRRQDYIYWYETLMAAKTARSIKTELSSYRVDSQNSLSANKKEMAKIQWHLLSSEFHLSFLKKVYYFIWYALNGVQKYLLK